MREIRHSARRISCVNADGHECIPAERERERIETASSLSLSLATRLSITRGERTNESARGLFLRIRANYCFGGRMCDTAYVCACVCGCVAAFRRSRRRRREQSSKLNRWPARFTISPSRQAAVVSTAVRQLGTQPAGRSAGLARKRAESAADRRARVG